MTGIPTNGEAPSPPPSPPKGGGGGEGCVGGGDLAGSFSGALRSPAGGRAGQGEAGGGKRAIPDGPFGVAPFGCAWVDVVG